MELEKIAQLLKRPSSRLFCGLLFFLTICSLSVVLVAQESPAEFREFLESENSPAENSYLPDSTASPINIGVQWRLWKQVARDGQIGNSELQALTNNAMSLGIPSLPSYQAAVLASHRAGQYKFPDADLESLYEESIHLATHLPYPHFEIAALRLKSSITSIGRAFPPYLEGLKLTATWLDHRVNWKLKGAIALLLALGIGFLGFIFAQLLRYFGIAAYDGTRVLPRGFSSTQTVILLIALVLVPGLLFQSPLLSIVLLLFLVIPFQQLNERIISALFLAVLATLPQIDQEIGRLLTYPGSDTQRLLHANMEGCHEECLPWLENQAKKDPDVAGFILATHLFRTVPNAELSRVEQLIENRPANTQLRGEWLTLQGATEIARGQADEALQTLRSATEALPQSPTPYFNEMRALQILGQTDESYVVLDQALRRNMAVVSRRLQVTRTDRASYLMLPPVSHHTLWNVHASTDEPLPSVIAPIWTVLAGPKVDRYWGLPMGAAGLLLLLLTLPLYLSRKVSTPCPKCALARDPTEAEDTNHHHYCLPCYQTFVEASQLDYHVRIHSEATLGRRDRLQSFLRRALSIVLPGTGHILAGHATRGFVTLMTAVLGALLLIWPQTLWRIPGELFQADWVGQAWIGWIALSIGVSVGLAGLVRGIEPTRIHRRRQRTRQR